MIYPSNLVSLFIQALIYFIVAIIFSIFSPLGIFFIIFSVIRAKTKNSSLKNVSLVFQIVLAVLTLMIGILIGILFSVMNLGFYFSGFSWVSTLMIILGVCFVFAIEIGVILWQTSCVKGKSKTN